MGLSRAPRPSTSRNGTWRGKRLLAETLVPLNNSGSKWVSYWFGSQRSDVTIAAIGAIVKKLKGLMHLAPILVEQCSNACMMDAVTITMDDGEGLVCSFQLSPEDADRANNDYEFAQSLMNSAKTATQVPPVVPPVNPSSTSVSPGPSSSNDIQENENFKWPHAAILLLVEAYRNHERQMTTGKVSQKKVWEKIGALMREAGHIVTGIQCMTKFNGMKRTYKAISDHNSKSGNNPRSWPYYEIMQSLLGERPFMEPPSTASSSSTGTASSSSTDSESIDGNNKPAQVAAKRKRKLDNYMSDLKSAILESRRIAEEGKDRRHAEKLATIESIMCKLDKFIQKL
ncbi:hypothetical protein FQR65_LT19199 [Abscondita terminalis]|nr:hypothetical protein FQR65_LT19199 [Abscondita terminalis]